MLKSSFSPESSEQQKTAFQKGTPPPGAQPLVEIILISTRSRTDISLWGISFPNTGGSAVSSDTLSPNTHRLASPLGPLGRRRDIMLRRIIRS